MKAIRSKADLAIHGAPPAFALHLAIAANAGETIVSLDRTLIKAALAVGIRAQSL